MHLDQTKGIIDVPCPKQAPKIKPKSPFGHSLGIEQRPWGGLKWGRVGLWDRRGAAFAISSSLDRQQHAQAWVCSSISGQQSIRACTSLHAPHLARWGASSHSSERLARTQLPRLGQLQGTALGRGGEWERIQCTECV